MLKNNFAGDLQDLQSTVWNALNSKSISPPCKMSVHNDNNAYCQPEIMNTVSGGLNMEKLKASGAVVHSVHDVHGQALSNNSCEVNSCGWIPAFKLYQHCLAYANSIE
jgi:hypothetical protein